MARTLAALALMGMALLGQAQEVLPPTAPVAAADEGTLLSETEGGTLLGGADGYALRRVHDSLYWLNEWRLPYPVYQLQTGDVDGDGRPDALVGVVKSTRFDPRQARRLFIFKRLPTGQVRPLWLGSRLGGQLQDFKWKDGRLRALETTQDSLYVVSEYEWKGFGLQFRRFIERGTDKENATKTFNL